MHRLFHSMQSDHDVNIEFEIPETCHPHFTAFFMGLSVLTELRVGEAGIAVEPSFRKQNMCIPTPTKPFFKVGSH